ncbi:FliH/SctL family protein [Paenibacillus cisolokensis]
MTSLSNLIKSSHVVPAGDRREIAAPIRYTPPADTAQPPANPAIAEPDEETVSLRDQLLADAQAFAEERIRDAAVQAEQMLEEAKARIEQWWSERRAEDERIIEEARAAATDRGYAEGKALSENELREQREQAIASARELLETAYRIRDQIIQEAEPFLVDLSCAIAEKIIDRQLTIEPEWSLDLIRKSLSRRREQGVITLCVAPERLAFVQAAREELTLAIDSQAELQILPDASVGDKGCVIRSAFGSIDARIDTQLAEIKRELIHLALQHDEREDDHEHR